MYCTYRRPSKNLFIFLRRPQRDFQIRLKLYPFVEIRCSKTSDGFCLSIEALKHFFLITCNFKSIYICLSFHTHDVITTAYKVHIFCVFFYKINLMGFSLCSE